MFTSVGCRSTAHLHNRRGTREFSGTVFPAQTGDSRHGNPLWADKGLMGCLVWILQKRPKETSRCVCLPGGSLMVSGEYFLIFLGISLHYKCALWLKTLVSLLLSDITCITSWQSIRIRIHGSINPHLQHTISYVISLVCLTWSQFILKLRLLSRRKVCAPIKGIK